MSKARAYVGIDSHSEFHKVAILPMFLMEGIAEEGDWEKNVKPKIKPSKVGNNREAYEGLHKVLATHGDPSEIVIGLEYTGGHYTAPLSHFLSGKGYQMWFVEAKAMKQFKEKFLGESNKTDKVDSREIGFYLYARAVLKRKLRVSTIRPEIGTQSAVIKQMIAHRWTIQKAITQTTNRLHGLMKSSFPEGEEEYFAQLLEIIPKYPTPKAILEESSGLADVKHMRKAVKADILKLAKETVGVPAEQYGYAIRTLATEREALQSQLEKVNQRIDYIVANHPYGTILRSFPQISTISAATLIGVIRDIDHYPTDRHLQKTLGVAPGQRQSGKNKGKGKMIYEGSKDARRVMYQIIFGCLSKSARPNDVRDLYQRLKENGKPGTSAMMRCSVVLCEQMYHCLKYGVFYEYQGGKRCVTAGQSENA